MDITSQVNCPNCAKQYASKTGLKRHLLSAYHLNYDLRNDNVMPYSEMELGKP